MSIRLRLIISYFLMFFIPLILIIIFAIGLIAKGIGSYEKTQNAEFEKFALNSSDVIYTFMRAKTESPEQFLDRNFLYNLEIKSKKLNTGFFVMHEKDFIYKSSFIGDNIANKLYDYAQNEKTKNKAHKKELPVIIENFTVNDTSYNLFIVYDAVPIGESIHDYFAKLSKSAILIIIITIAIITFFVSRKIIKPLMILKNAALKIRDGNLNFEIKYKSRDELGEVCNAFEQMRIHLQNSIQENIQNDLNRKELLSNISHDLKTPITSIKGYIEGIIDKVPDSPEMMDRYIKTIHQKSIHMDKLIDDLFMFSKLDLKKLPFDYNNVNVIKYIESIMEELTLDLEKKNFKVDINYLIDNDSKVKIDINKTRRVILNIIENAVKYCEKEEKIITFTVSEKNNFIEFNITDNGKGINPDDLNKIFQRFYRTDSARNSETGGSGLGLPIAKQIIESQGGNILAKSKVGEFTSIIFNLPKLSNMLEGEI